MEATSLVLSAAQTLFAALQYEQLKEICSLWGYETELERLQDTVSTIKSVLLDAEAREVMSHQQQNYVEKLKGVVYDADDLLDEFTALAEQQQHLLKGGKVSKKVHLLFSRFGKLGVAHKMSKQVKKIRKELDSIASDASKFSYKVDNEPIRKRREDSCSYVHERDVIGREKETEDIVKMLISPDVVQGDMSVLAIVGMGGLGKTTLAQLVYQDERVKNDFPLRLWACVSDQYPNQLFLQPILAKILESAKGQKQDGSGIELVQTQLRGQLQGKKYLLILDDVWTEDRDEWIKLENFLMGGGRGSRVVVTTRSKRTARVVGSNNSYELKGLSEENSWLLFERLAFEEGERQRDRHELVGIGREIVKKCANVPLSIRVVGSLLYGQGKQKWLDFQQNGLSIMKQDDNPIMSILKLSYHHLHPSLKSCFSFCAVFPKDSVMRKEKLISLWMAHDYIEQLPGVQSIEDASEEYFMILLRRCFFQDVETNEVGEIYSCKMHDLMHDMAQEIAGKEICVANSTTISLDKKIRHVHDAFGNYPESFFTNSKIRTYLHHSGYGYGLKFPFISIAATKWMCLRVLDLSHIRFGVCRLPDSIGNLLHLRYIDLSYNHHLETLPESIINLHYLQTLFLRHCQSLKALPKDFSKLINLRLLDVYDSRMTCMPCGMAKLTCLRRLTMFVVSDRNSGSKHEVGDLEDLRALNDLKGNLIVRINKKYKYVKEEGRECRYLSNKKNLNSIEINWAWDRKNEGRVDDEEALLEDLLPHHNLKVLKVSGYDGVRWPTWGEEEKLETFLPNLVMIFLYDCRGLQELPSLGKLHCLKSITLWKLEKLEYMENTSGCGSVEAPFFPSLETLELHLLPKLKGWWRGWSISYGDDPFGQWVSFPRLSHLTITDCPDLTSIPLCPTVQKMQLINFNEGLRITRDEKEVGGTYTSASLTPSDSGNRKLRGVETDNGRYLKCLPMGAFQNLTEMKIIGNQDMENLSQVEEMLRSCSSSLRSLELTSFPKLGSLLGGGLEHLTVLESLTLGNLPSLSLDEGEEEEGIEIMTWRCLHQSLRSLTLQHLPNVVNLPKGMQYLTSLQSLCTYSVNLEALPEWIDHLSYLQCLRIGSCKRLESLPESMRHLTSLTELTILDCSARLKERCRSPSGEDWPKIQHIPRIFYY